MKNNNLKYRLSGTALACCIGLSSFASHAYEVDLGDAGTLEFKADAFIKGYYLDDQSVGSSKDSQGAKSQVRLTLNMENTDGWAINSRWLANYDWAGDRRESGGSGSDFNSADNVDSISLDTGYLQYSGAESWLLRIGRQEANWAYNFNITDDRRDRILAMKSIPTSTGHISLLAIYDLRFAQQQQSDETSYGDDLSMYALAAMGNHNGLDWGLLWAYFDGEPAKDLNKPNPYNINTFHNISPYFSKQLGKFSIKAAANLILSDASDESNLYAWGNDSWSAFIETGYQIQPGLQIQAQVAAIADGGLVGRGWDSYSMLINNSPRNEASPVSTTFFGGIGESNGGGEDGTIYGLRANWQASQNWTITMAAGQMDLDHYSAATIKTTFADIKAIYQFSENTSVELRAGHADGDVDDTAVLTTLRVKFG